MPAKTGLTLNRLKSEQHRLQQPGTEKERAILTAATALFDTRGVRGATTAQIARAAGVTERTLFRYFPSKDDLYRRVMWPLLLRVLPNDLRALIATPEPDFATWYGTLLDERLAAVGANPGLARTLLVQLLEDECLRAQFGALWRAHAWTAMLAAIDGFKSNGVLDPACQPEVLARAIFSLNIGYFLARHVFAPDAGWDQAADIEAMSELLLHGAGASPKRSTSKPSGRRVRASAKGKP